MGHPVLIYIVIWCHVFMILIWFLICLTKFTGASENKTQVAEQIGSLMDWTLQTNSTKSSVNPQWSPWILTRYNFKENCLMKIYLFSQFYCSKIPPWIWSANYRCHPRLLGPTLGYMLGSASLKMYVNPDVEVDFNEKDPRWIGAWWFGYPIIGSLILFFAIPLVCFPQRLPKQGSHCKIQISPLTVTPSGHGESVTVTRLSL